MKIRSIDWRNLSWVVFHGISWQRDIKNALAYLFRKKFPRLHALQDRVQFHLNLAGIDKSAPDMKERLIQADIKTEYGRKLIAKAMAGRK